MEKTIVVLSRSSEHQKIVARFGGLLAMSNGSAYDCGYPNLFTI